MGRIDKENYYLDIAETVSERSTCEKLHNGALIVRNDEIVSTGYNGAPRGRANCIDLGYCVRDRLGIPDGERSELCRSVHAEANAIISAARSECIGGTMYLAGRTAEGSYIDHLRPCPACRRMIINAGLSKVIIRTDKDKYDIVNVPEWVFHDDSILDPSEADGKTLL